MTGSHRTSPFLLACLAVSTVAFGSRPAVAGVSTRVSGLSPASFNVGGTVNLTAQVLRKSDGRLTTGVSLPVEFFIDRRSVGIAYTNSGSGTAVLPFKPRENYASGANLPRAYSYQARCKGGSGYDSSDSDSKTINCYKGQLALAATSIGTVTAGTQVKLTIKATRQDGEVSSGRTIQFRVNNIDLGTARTDSQGVATKTYRIPARGTYYAEFRVVADNYYHSGTARTISFTAR